ncbi:MAG TPA: NAD(P)-dependent oxidoreductase [Burkholderiales bacterium]|nr:NAD(P)-dependent oxidoreductase [Burkholderiales bacterium]
MLEHLNAAPTRPERVVIIGAGGFVGGAILKKLRDAGTQVLALTRRELDLLDAGATAKLAQMLKPQDSVVMVSAVAPAKNVTMLMQNLKMAEAVCAALAEKSIAHLLYISSDAVYADDANPVTEDSYCAPTTLHGMMHAARELMLKSATTAPFAALRPTLIYGADDPHNGYGPNRFRRQAGKGEPISIFGEGEERRDHIWVEDVAALAVRMLERRSRGALNAVTGVSTSFHDIAQMVAAQFPGAVVKSAPRPGPRPHLLHRFFDITQCLKAFPDFRFTPLREGLGHSQTDQD